MGTKAAIKLKQAKNEILLYKQFDGDPGYCGAILRDFIFKKEKKEKWCNLGRSTSPIHNLASCLIKYNPGNFKNSNDYEGFVLDNEMYCNASYWYIIELGLFETKIKYSCIKCDSQETVFEEEYKL